MFAYLSKMTGNQDSSIQSPGTGSDEEEAACPLCADLSSRDSGIQTYGAVNAELTKTQPDQSVKEAAHGSVTLPRCGHSFCLSCLRKYCSVPKNEDAVRRKTQPCPQEDCEVEFEPEGLLRSIKEIFHKEGSSDDEGKVDPSSCSSSRVQLPRASLEESDVDNVFVSRASSSSSSNGSNTKVYSTVCPICLGDFSLPDIETGGIMNSSLVELPSCKHAFCNECLQDYCDIKISEHKIPIACPKAADQRQKETSSTMSDTKCMAACSAFLSDLDVQTIYKTDFGTWLEGDIKKLNKYDRIKRLKGDKSLMECPRCDTLNDTKATTVSSSDLTCTHCSHTFCVEHGDLHPSLSCKEFWKTDKGKEMRRTEATLQEHTKPCSRCGVAIQKGSGCDLVLCPICDDVMCFRCGTHRFLSEGTTTRECSGCHQGYIDHRFQTRGVTVFRIFLFFTVVVPLSILYMVLALAVAIATGSCFCCFCCGNGLENEFGNPMTAKRAISLGVTTVFMPLVILLDELNLLCCFDFDRVINAPALEIESLPAVRSGNESEQVDEWSA